MKLEGDVRKAFEKEVFDKLLTAEIPKFFNECKVIAKPDLLLKGPPNPQDIRERVNTIMQTGGTTQPMPTPMTPMTPPMLPPTAPKQ